MAFFCKAGFISLLQVARRLAFSTYIGTGCYAPLGEVSRFPNKRTVSLCSGASLEFASQRIFISGDTSLFQPRAAGFVALRIKPLCRKTRVRRDSNFQRERDSLQRSEVARFVQRPEHSPRLGHLSATRFFQDVSRREIHRKSIYIYIYKYIYNT